MKSKECILSNQLVIMAVLQAMSKLLVAQTPGAEGAGLAEQFDELLTPALERTKNVMLFGSMSNDPG